MEPRFRRDEAIATVRPAAWFVDGATHFSILDHIADPDDPACATLCARAILPFVRVKARSDAVVAAAMVVG